MEKSENNSAVLAEPELQVEPLKAYKLRIAKLHQSKPGYNEARAIKDVRIRELRSSGLDDDGAVRQAWAELDAKLRGVDLPPVKVPRKLVVVEGASETDFVSAARWVLDHLVVQVELEQAPSPGAWAMLLWARESQADFFKQVLPKALDIEAKRAAAVPVAEEEDEADIADLLA